MTALVSSHSQSAFLLSSAPDSTSGGILLSPRSFSAPLDPHHHHHHHPSSIASSSSSVSQTSDARSHSSTFTDSSSRKIRFAPLPEPRREDLPFASYPEDSDSDSPSRLARHATAPPNYVPPGPPSPALSAQDLTDGELHSDDATFREKSSKPKRRKWGQSLLRPLLQPLLPSNGTKCGDDGSPSLFRISSRDSTKSNGGGDSPAEGLKGGVPLSRRMSTGCRDVLSPKEAERFQLLGDGVALAHVASEGAGSKGRKEGQRMLNGRVYGRRASSADREREERRRNEVAAEPEFVEWGYGGMGSVSNDHTRGREGRPGPDWAKVQSRGKVLGEGEDGDPEGDDGSGMGWVKRRREQREREKREKEEREKLQREHGVPEIEVHPPEQKEKEDQAPRPSSEGKEEEHHVYKAVSVPAPPHHHIRHYSHYKGGETSGTVTPTSLSRANSAGSVPKATPAQRDISTEAQEQVASSGSSVNSSTSNASSESLGDEDGDTERESEDEEEEDEESRITSKCAGVEKISRHKE